jgi:hypothetical protein
MILLIAAGLACLFVAGTFCRLSREFREASTFAVCVIEEERPCRDEVEEILTRTGRVAAR